MVDLDHFKRINDTYAHATSGSVLKAVVDRVMSASRPLDLVSRRGGDEFAVTMPETDLDAAIQIGERLRARVCEAPIEGVAVTVSIGGAVLRPNAQEELDTTLERADAALYEAKRAGGNQVSAGRTPPPGN